MNNLHLKKSMNINASKNEVWEALTNPEILKKTLFGCDVITEWKVGSQILFKGSWEGNDFVDKGTVLDFKDGESYEYDYWSSFSGLPDSPENYSVIKFELRELSKGETLIKLEQSNFAKETMYEHSDKNWGIALNTLKELIEKNNATQQRI